MPLVVILSSHVAASRVGGGLGALILPAFSVDPVHVPTTLLGRHPGHGPPGGGAVPDALFAGMLAGVEARGLLPLADAILTGYFASVAQVEAAALFIDRVRAMPAGGISGRREVWVDPVLGDAPGGLYVPAEVALAIRDLLVPRADVLTPNLFELGWLLGQPTPGPGTVPAAARKLRDRCAPDARVLVTSARAEIDGEDCLGVLMVMPQTQGGAVTFAGLPPRHGDIPRGTGDCLVMCLLGHRLKDSAQAPPDPVGELSAAVGAVDAVISRALVWGADELPLAACQDVIRDPPLARRLALRP